MSLSDEIQLPQLDSLADIQYAQETPASWDADYRKIWQELQVANRNKTQLGGYIRELRSRLSQAIAQRDKAVKLEAELRCALKLANGLAKDAITQRDKGLAREAELQQRLAEAEKKFDDAADLLRRAKQMIPVLQYNWHANADALLSSSGCADGEKAE